MNQSLHQSTKLLETVDDADPDSVNWNFGGTGLEVKSSKLDEVCHHLVPVRAQTLEMQLKVFFSLTRKFIFRDGNFLLGASPIVRSALVRSAFARRRIHHFCLELPEVFRERIFGERSNVRMYYVSLFVILNYMLLLQRQN